MERLVDHRFGETLRAFGEAGTLLAFDFDGTLAPLVADRDAARMRPRTAILLRAVCTCIPTVIISGRGRRDVIARLGASTTLAVVGSHGADADAHPSPTAVALMREVIAHLVTAGVVSTARPSAIDLEDKQVSIALHWRDPAEALVLPAAQQRLLDALGSLASRVRLVPGHRVLNIVPAGLPHKGDALRRLVKQHDARRVLFVGDDITDEDVFALDEPWLTGVRIGYTNASRAQYYLADQLDIDRLLLALLRARRPRH